MNRFLPAIFTVLALVSPLAAGAAATPAQQLMSKLEWRSIGPYIGGRVVAIAAVPRPRSVLYGRRSRAAFGRAPTTAKTGRTSATESCRRSPPRSARWPSRLPIRASSMPEPAKADIRKTSTRATASYKTTDAGTTWAYAGLREAHHDAALVVDPRNANVVFAASMGHVFKPNPERGIYKTTDGGKTWRKVLLRRCEYRRQRRRDRSKHTQHALRNDVAGAALSLDARQRRPGKRSLQNHRRRRALDERLEESRLRRRDTRQDGRFAFAQSDPRIVYAMVQASDGGVFRSDDAGATWKHVNDEMKLRQRAFYYMAIYVDPTDPQSPSCRKSTGRTRDERREELDADRRHRGDHHIIWVDPTNHRKSNSKATTAERRSRSTAARRGAPSTISRPGRSITCRSTISFRSIFTARQQDEGA